MMLRGNPVFHHFGLAVRDPEAALHQLSAFGYTGHPPVYDELQKVHLILCRSEVMPDVEIIYAGDESGPLDSILKHGETQIYHTCYEVDDLEETLAGWEDRKVKFRCVAPPKPAVLFGGRKVSFYYLPGFGLVELLEPDEC
ncbi:VOC family protein [bacterium]|nr:VOC family protein [bacterium]